MISGGYYNKEDGKPALFRDAYIFDVEELDVTRQISDNLKIFHKQKSLPVVQSEGIFVALLESGHGILKMARFNRNTESYSVI